MINYHSTRGEQKSYTFSGAILKGIASDGGLLVPEKIPQFSLEQLEKLQYASYQEVAGFVFSLFETDLPREIIMDIILQAYSSNFDSEHVTPVVSLKENQFLLELWHGPTAAFKDLALQIMPLLFSAAIKKNTQKLRYLILVATSGDTGIAALEGYKDKEAVSIMVLFPDKHVSQLQELQMRTQEGSNIAVLGVTGDFDAVQKSVKDVFNDSGFNTQLSEHYNTVLSSANSINWGRLLPQIIYHIYGYLQMVNKGAVPFGNPIDIAVPSGNFGNMLAAFYAKKMGLPVRRFVCASNANNVLTDFFRTGRYDIEKRHLMQTPSPAMDILIASNIERLLYLITNDTEKVRGWMEELKVIKKFSVDEKTKQVLQQEFFAGWATNDQSLETIKSVFDETGYLMDPHTAVAQTVADNYLLQVTQKLPVLISSTAHFSKFAKDVYKALTNSADSGKDEFTLLDGIIKLAPKISIHRSIATLKNKKILHTAICETGKEAIEKEITDFLK